MFLQNRITKDAITEITKAKGVANIEKFMVAGASKVRNVFFLLLFFNPFFFIQFSADGKTL